MFFVYPFFIHLDFGDFCSTRGPGGIVSVFTGYVPLLMSYLQLMTYVVNLSDGMLGNHVLTMDVFGMRFNNPSCFLVF